MFLAIHWVLQTGLIVRIPGGAGEDGRSGAVGFDRVTGLLWLSHSAELRLVGSENIAGFKSRSLLSLLLSSLTSWMAESSTSCPSPLSTASSSRTGLVANTFFCFS